MKRTRSESTGARSAFIVTGCNKNLEETGQADVRS